MKKTRKKWIFEEVLQYFTENGCTLLTTDYKTTRQKLDFICSCDNKSKITFDHFKRGVRCSKCSKDRTKEKLKLNIDDIRKLYEERGCVLLEDEYTNKNTKMKYICHCGELNYTTFGSFKKSKYCLSCSGKKKYDYNFVHNYFKEQGCILLEKDYVNNSTPMEYKCICGNESKIRFDNFKKGQRCAKCVGNEKFTYDYVFNYFKDNDCLLLSNEYISSGKHLDYTCSCGNQSTITFSAFKEGYRCSKCNEKYKRYDYDFVKLHLEGLGCTLLSTEYNNMFIPLDYVCACGNKTKKRFFNFIYGNQLCMKCSGKRSAEKTKGVPRPYTSGENSYRWKGGKSNIQEYLRYRISSWKYVSAEAFNFKCIVTGNRFNVVHHLQGFNLIVDEALNKLSLPIHAEIKNYSQNELDLLVKEVSNLHYKYGLGLPLSNEIHKDFHSKYGIGGNTVDQFIDYINKYHPQINIEVILKITKAVV